MAAYFSAQRRERRYISGRPAAEALLGLAKDTYLQRRLKYLEQHSFPGSAPDFLRAKIGPKRPHVKSPQPKAQHSNLDFVSWPKAFGSENQ
jgi:hypothetical protein